VTYSGTPQTFVPNAVPLTPQNDGVLITVDSAGAPNGGYIVTLTGFTCGTSRTANSTGIAVGTDGDLPGLTGYPALGGEVTAARLTISAVDRVAGDNRKVTVTFRTATALAGGDSIYFNFNFNNYSGGFVQPSENQAVILGIGASAKFYKDNITMTLTQATAAAAVYVVTICGVKLGPFPVNNPYGFAVSTSKDYTTTCSETGTISAVQGRVRSVSMSIPWADRLVGNTLQSVLFTFTTQTDIPAAQFNCAASNGVTISFPAKFFESNAAPGCPSTSASGHVVATGLEGYALTASGAAPASDSTFVLTGVAALPAAAYDARGASVCGRCRRAAASARGGGVRVAEI
jgi:hypothetical protein